MGSFMSKIESIDKLLCCFKDVERYFVFELIRIIAENVDLRDCNKNDILIVKECFKIIYPENFLCQLWGRYEIIV